MGRSHGHIATEVALQTHVNAVLTSEIIEERKLTLADVIRELADTVAARAATGKNFGVFLVAEGVVTAIPELRTLVTEMNALFHVGVVEPAAVTARLTPWSAAVLSYLPPLVRQQLFLERESSGSIQLSQVASERALADLVGDELARRAAAGAFKGKYATVTHFFGYQARSAMPSDFDCAYGLALGHCAAALTAHGCNGYLATIRGLAKPVAEWVPAGVPLTAMVSVPVSAGGDFVSTGAAPAASRIGGAGAGAGAAAATQTALVKVGARPVVASVGVDPRSAPAQLLKRLLAGWRLAELYGNPGPIQFSGETAAAITTTLACERHDYMARIATLREKLEAVREVCRPGVSDALLDAALSGVVSLAHILTVMRERE